MTLLVIGEQAGDNNALAAAVRAYHAALEERTRDRVPLLWAKTQNNLGGALARLGERESGTARLEEALAAFHAALEECRRDRVPLLWATIQTNLGAALMWVGERERGTARLEEAVAAHRAALEERTRDRVPLLWATTQNRLGAALTSVGGVVTAGSPVTLYAKAGSQPTALIDLTPAPPQSATQCRVSLSGLLTP